LLARAADIRARFAQLEAALGEGPFFAGESFSIVDAVFGPALRYFDVIDEVADFGWWTGLPKLQAWRSALACRPSVAQAVRPDYAESLRRFLRARGTALSGRMSS
jgi:glutathione S-transferase